MAVKIGDWFFDVTADTQNAIKSVDGLTGAAVQAGNLISGALSAAFDAVAYAAKTAVVLITKDIIEMGVEFNIAGQRAVGLFTALTGSAEEAVDIVKQFGQLSLDQPIFDAAALQKTTATLLTYGVAKDDVLELAENINLTAVALGKGARGAEQLALAFGQIQGKGKLEGQEVRQLGEVGVNAYSVIAEAVGKTTAEVTELGRQNKLLAEDVLPILNAHLEKTFGPVAQNLVNTYGVQAQGLKNVLTGIGSALVEPFISRAGGGVLVDFLADARSELGGLVKITEDGSYTLTGVLAPLNDLTAALADGFADMGASFIGFLGDAAESGAVTGFFDGLADIIPVLVDGIQDFASGTADFLGDMAAAIAPLIPSIEQIAGILVNLVVDALPEIARILVEATGAASELLVPLLKIGIALLAFASPAIITLLTGIADALALIGDNIGLIEVGVAAWLAWEGAIVIAEVATASFVTVALNPLIVALGAIAVQAGVALLAIGALQSTSAALKGDIGFLDEDVPIYEKPFQLAGRLGFDLGSMVSGGGQENRELAQQAEEFETAQQAAEEFNLTLLDGAESFIDARTQALQYGAALGLNVDQANDFANIVALAWKKATDGAHSAFEAADAFEARLKGTGGGGRNTFLDEDDILKDTEYLRLLKDAAKEATDAVDDLLNPSTDATIDDFLSELPKLAEDLTTAMREAGDGILGDLERGSVLEGVGNKARKVINTLVDDYGLSLEEIKSLLDERGLTAVIEALSDATQVAVQEVDPLIEAYGDLGYSAKVLKSAVDSLNSQRTNAIKAQITELTTALDAAKTAAEDAKEALMNYFTGDTGGVQGAIDDLVLDIPDIGSDIEKALRTGGVQGEAGVRSAMAGIGKNLGSIFQLGLEQGLSPEEIIAMLGPVYGSIQQEVGGALGRIASLNWEDGFTPAAAAEIQEWLAGILDPGQIADLFAGVTGSSGLVKSLEDQIAGLNAQLDVEGVFSQEQVQAAIDELYPPEIQTEPVVTPEAAQAIFDEIQGILDNEDLEVAIDNQLLTQDILDAANDAQDQLAFKIDSELIFNPSTLEAMAAKVGDEFADVFRIKFLENLGVEDPKAKLEEPIKPVTAPGADVGTGRGVNINNQITIDGARDPRATASEVVAASSAAASSGGKYDPSKFARYGAGAR
jgi:tape measure domain-containing protein